MFFVCGQYVGGRHWFKWRVLFLMVGYCAHSVCFYQSRKVVLMFDYMLVDVQDDGISSGSLLFLYFRSNTASVGLSFSSTQTQCTLCNKYSQLILLLSLLSLFCNTFFIWTPRNQDTEILIFSSIFSANLSGNTQWLLLLTVIILVVLKVY